MHKSFEKKYHRYLLNIKIAKEALLANKMRSFLSALGIIFGVASVISMLAIGKGTEQEIMDKMKEVGVNNIVIQPFSQSGDRSDNDTKSGNNEKSDDSGPMQFANQKKKYSPGLTTKDIEAIREVLPNVTSISPYKEKVLFASHEGRYSNATIKAVMPEYFSMFNLAINEGSIFTNAQCQSSLAVCVISENAKRKFFGAKPAVGKQIKVGQLWFTVTGILRDIYKEAKEKTEDLSIYIPIQSYLLRIENNANIKPQTSMGRRQNQNQDQVVKHQLDKVIVQIANTEELQKSAEVLNKIMLRKHQGVKDYEIHVPELLLKQQEETKSIFNMVLGIIAGISLLVGGIGIMNIMNASVLERTREIGVRLATGANKQDITLQFLAEAVLICLSGGVIGVIAGIIMSYLIMNLTGIATIISLGGIFISFFVTTAVGVFFGYYPARNASKKDPIESLRYE